MIAFFAAGYPEMRFTEMDPALKVRSPSRFVVPFSPLSLQALSFQFTPLETFVKDKVAPKFVQ